MSTCGIEFAGSCGLVQRDSIFRMAVATEAEVEGDGKMRVRRSRNSSSIRATRSTRTLELQYSVLADGRYVRLDMRMRVREGVS